MQIGKFIKYIIICITFLLCGCLYSCEDSSKTKVSLKEDDKVQTEELKVEYEADNNKDSAQDNTMIYVYICGEVENPGVYQVEEGARLYQVVELAGGISENAADDYLNLAECVEDGQKIIVPSEEDAEQLEQSDKESASGLVNINTADEEKLTTLPGIGTSKAKCIIAYRESKGKFQTIEELMQIEGIKEGVFNKVKDMITVK